MCDIHDNNKSKSNLSSDLSCTSAERLAQHIEQISPSFTVGHQQDPSEFLILLLDHFITCLSPIEYSNKVDRISTPIDIVFGLRLQSTTRCNTCFNESIVMNWESVLSVPIASYSSIGKALEVFFSKQELNGENLYECIDCQKMTPASTTLRILKAAPVIFIHLKRFNYDVELQTTVKLHQYVPFPEILDLTSYVDKTAFESNKENNTNNDFIYKLNSVVVHLGKNANSGHVFSYVRAPDAAWYKTDDESISFVNFDTVLRDKDAYILCYTKVLTSETVLSDTHVVPSHSRSLSLFTSSTPIHPNKLVVENSNNLSV